MQGQIEHQIDHQIVIKLKISLSNIMSRFPHELTPELSAALVIESLSINHHESIEGMAKCYDGIVSAGMALLDSRMRS